MNQARTQYIRSRLTDLHHHHHQSSSLMTHSQLSKLSIVDIGCGGGLASESLARSGAHVTGVDAAAENIAVARIHAMRDPALSGGQLTYRQATAEQLVGEQKQFDAVVSLEVIEHVRDPVFFVKLLVDLAKPGAPIFISTMNRTLVSLVVDVVVPEYVLGVVPKGTHEHAKFVPPAELEQMLSAVGAQTLDVAGLVMNPLSNSCQVVPRHWGLLRDAGVQANYILMARKRM
ncbi:Hexaprenyldihydroxybenzoate methyltransferase, mitochondrial [Linderina macrospora]|uniref:Hexaprenyldihydroxybenzoate methyltransferase, mitochondrial n=1 Tax=Linderina macrospora TaxID=4868 RepID=A0ACC1JBI9_9FUNG|nr:Hexaprenyldihydroxybenzoate methyltransferase, mitochondrial [Linderina macrospora]